MYQLYGDSGDRNEIAALVRDEKKASQLLKSFPQVRIVPGEMDDVEIIEREAKKADIVFRTSEQRHPQ